jgi:hypothetical protein
MRGHFDFETFDWYDYDYQSEREWNRWAAAYLSWWATL